jgi:hypothetical protein
LLEVNAASVHKIIVRPSLRFPMRGAASPALLRMMDRLQAQVDVARHAASIHPPDDPAWLATIPWDAKRNELTHPLSSTWLQQGTHPRRKEARDTVAEFQACLSARHQLEQTLHAVDAGEFTQALCKASALLCPEAGGRLRDMPIGLEQDGDGTQVLFGDAADVPARLAELHADHRDCRWPPVVRAVATMAVLLNIHPFVDGNGRCARALFNIVLMDAVGPETEVESPVIADNAQQALLTYVPLRDALAASDGGYELRLREAETHGNWAPLINYFIAVFAALADAYTRGPGRQPAG